MASRTTEIQPDTLAGSNGFRKLEGSEVNVQQVAAAGVGAWSWQVGVGAPAHTASETLTSEPAGEAYNFVTHYRIQIEAPASRVWPVLLDLESWMYEFENASVSGTPGTAGHVSRLYEGQDFLTQVTGVVPQKMLSIANLPLTFKGEHGTGVGVFTLHENGNGTEVSLSMSRRYTAAGEGFSELLEAAKEKPVA